MDAEQARTAAHATVLDGLREGTALQEIERGVVRCRVRGVYEPDLAMLELIVAALDAAGVSRRQPVDSGDWPARYLPELAFRNRHSERERLALAWTEALTLVAQTGAPDTDYEALKSQFSETEIVHLTLLIGAINLWNRLQVGLRAVHPVDAPRVAA